MDILLNSTAIALSFYILTTCFFKFKDKEKTAFLFLILFIIDFITNFYFSDVSKFQLFAFVIMLAYVTKSPEKKYLKNILNSINVLFYIQIIVLFLGSIAFYTLHNLYHNKMFFSVYMTVGLVCISLLIKIFYKVFFKDFFSIKTYAIDSMVKLVFLILIYFLVPYLPIAKNEKLFYEFVLIMIVIAIVFKILSDYIYSIEFENYQTKLKNENLESNSENINKKFEEIVVLKHFYFKLFKGLRKPLIIDKDLKSATDYFNTYIAPVHDEIIMGQKHAEKIDLIKCPLLKSLMYETLYTCEKLTKIDFRLHIENEVDRISLHSVELFKVLTIFIDNATEEVENREQGYVEIYIHYSTFKFIFKIVNSLENKPKNKDFNTHKGLEIARKIMTENENVTINAYAENDKRRFIQIMEVNNI